MHIFLFFFVKNDTILQLCETTEDLFRERKEGISMKKLAAILMTLFLMVSLASAEDAVTVTWDMVAEDFAQNGFEGAFMPLNDFGVMMLVPEGFEAVELTEEEAAMNMYLKLDAQGQAGIGFQYMEGSAEDFAALAEELSGRGMVGIEYDNVNGLNGLSFDTPDGNAKAILVDCQNGYLLQITFAPATDETFVKWAQYMVASIQPISED